MEYRIVDGAEEMKINEVVRLLKMTYWADKRSVEQIEKSMRNSSCYGVYLDDENKLVGFARVISDYATTYYLWRNEISTLFLREEIKKPADIILRLRAYLYDLHHPIQQSSVSIGDSLGFSLSSLI